MTPAAILHAIGLILLALAIAGVAYTLAATILIGRYRTRDAAPATPDGEAPDVTLLKPLHGDEPGLTENLLSFLRQDHAGRVQMVCGVQDARDPAIAAVRAAQAALPAADIVLVVDPAPHGANAKVSNLVNMLPAARHPLIVLSDSDMAAPPDYLARIVAALCAPGVGAVTCLYHGRGRAGFWSRVAAAGIGWQFLPGVVVGLALGLAKPCMGSTIALTRETLDRIGGFARFADILADDHAIGASVRALGLRVAVPPMILAHGCSERGLVELARHELRWLATVRGLDPAGHAGSLVTYPLPLALLGLLLAGPGPLALCTLAAAAIVRLLLVLRIGHITGEDSLPLWLLPFRDVLSCVLFLIAFFIRSVDWRGARLKMAGEGRIAA